MKIEKQVNGNAFERKLDKREELERKVEAQIAAQKWKACCWIMYSIWHLKRKPDYYYYLWLKDEVDEDREDELSLKREESIHEAVVP